MSLNLQAVFSGLLSDNGAVLKSEEPPAPPFGRGPAPLRPPAGGDESPTPPSAGQQWPAFGKN